MPCHVCRAASGRIWYTHIAELANGGFFVGNANTVSISGNPKYFHTGNFSERGGGSSPVDGSPASAAAMLSFDWL